MELESGVDKRDRPEFRIVSLESAPSTDARAIGPETGKDNMRYTMRGWGVRRSGFLVHA